MYVLHKNKLIPIISVKVTKEFCLTSFLSENKYRKQLTFDVS